MAKRSKKVKDAEEPAYQGAAIYHPVKPPVNGVYPEASDEEIERLKAQPAWIWGGLYETAQRLFARIEGQEARLGGKSRSKREVPSDVTPLD